MPALRIVLGTHGRIQLTGHAPPAGQLQLGTHRAAAVSCPRGHGPLVMTLPSIAARTEQSPAAAWARSRDTIPVLYMLRPDGGPGSQLMSDAPADSTAISSIPKSRSRSSSPYSWAWSRTSPTSTVWLGPGSRAIPSKADSKRSLSRPRRMIRYLLVATAQLPYLCASPEPTGPAPTGTAEMAPEAARCWAWVMAQAALISPMWLNAWGKLPIISPLPASTSSASRPTSLIAATARSKVAVAGPSSPASA